MKEREFTCIKCGGNDISIRHITNTINVTTTEPNDYLACKCRRCEYRWREDCFQSPDNRDKR